MELASTGQQAAWLKSISGEVGLPILEPIPLCMDNQAAIFLTVNPAVEHQTKHIDIQLETEHSDKELYWIIVQSRPVQMILY